jgi:hypothetical protein
LCVSVPLIIISEGCKNLISGPSFRRVELFIQYSGLPYFKVAVLVTLLTVGCCVA